ncbi:MAG: hypothetical protein HRT74_07305 [Flavobacteriales bacterium]|nr:hypothetical protein [Flavobacteriales bacterium]
MNTQETAISAKKPSVFEEHDPQVRVRTKKMLMYFIIFAVVMLFAGFTSAYVLSNTGNYWVHINPPMSFYYSLGALVLSSITMVLAMTFIKRGNQMGALGMVGATFALGIAFSVFQLDGWDYLSTLGMGSVDYATEDGVATRWRGIGEIEGTYGMEGDWYVTKDGELIDFQLGEFYAANDPLKENPITRKVMNNSNISSSYLVILIWAHIIHLVFGLIYMVVNGIRIVMNKINSKDFVQLQTNGTYWHFMGILWVYLFVFLFIIH